MSETTNAVASPPQTGAVSTKSAKRTIQTLLEGDDFKAAVAKALPKHLKPDRFIRVAVTAMTRTPKLALCDQASFFNALLTLSQYGIEPDGRRAHLIPFNNTKRGCIECQLIIDWKGLAELVMRSGMVSNLHADVVCEGDLFDYSAGQLKSHVPWFLRRDKERPAAAGDIYAVYSLCRFKDGSEKCEAMSLQEVDAIRKRSKSANAGPWVSDYNEMAKKTVFRRLAKWLPLSAEFRDVLDLDDKNSGITIDVTNKIPLLDEPKPRFAVEDGSGDPEPEAGEPPPPRTELPPREPGGAEPPKTEPPKAARRVNYLKGVNDLIAMAKLDEADVIEFLHVTGKADESLISLSEVGLVAPSALEYLFNNWADVEARIKEVKAGAQ